MDLTPGITYIQHMSAEKPDFKTTFKQLGGFAGLLRRPGVVLNTLRTGAYVGEDGLGNHYYRQRKTRNGARARRWVVFAGLPDASAIGPEWHSWLHYTTDAPLPETGRKLWQKSHLPNLTGTASGYRPAGHDYEGGVRAHAAADYESWTPES